MNFDHRIFRSLKKLTLRLIIFLIAHSIKSPLAASWDEF